ncbi:hypothetical protein COMA2_60054 [Candidatus Nitrospira nitrificans]|uniref:Uncharacterized protein n=1 Tax=Candidatus Nitrospira nitrificans TaxID=1742973 RepID=A0A0S4LPP2_9BACT|nr:hypothetical protein COMA2_60054 [Candidatus Nitrospira nitrificans]
MVLKHAKYVVEELVESLEHAHAIKDVMHDIEPPQPFILFESSRLGYGKNRRWRFTEGSTERMLDRERRVRFLWKAEFNGMSKVDFSDRSVHVKEGIGCVEKHNSYRRTHDGFTVISFRNSVAYRNASQIRSPIGGFLDKAYPPC